MQKFNATHIGHICTDRMSSVVTKAFRKFSKELFISFKGIRYTHRLKNLRKAICNIFLITAAINYCRTLFVTELWSPRFPEWVHIFTQCFTEAISKLVSTASLFCSYCMLIYICSLCLISLIHSPRFRVMLKGHASKPHSSIKIHLNNL